MIETTFDSVLDYISNLHWRLGLRVFWLFIFLDFPRYVLTDIYIFFYEMCRRLKLNKDEELFIMKLRKTPPLVSVIVPVMNEQETIEWTIRSLKEQTYRNLQIIIIDDGSTDRTPDICSKFKSQKGILYLRFAERAGKSAALNYGLKFATGEYVVFIDSDTTFDRDAIINLIKTFYDPEVGAVSGNLRPRNSRKNLLTSLQHIEYLFTISVGRRIRAHFGILPIVSGAFGGFRRQIISLESIGGHEPGPGNDSDITIRLRKLGYKVSFASDAMCHTNVPETPYSLIKQRWRWDRNLVKNRLRKHKDVYNPFSQNFRLREVVSFVDSLFFHVVLSLVTVFYLIDISVNYPRILPFILLLNYLLYFFSELIELVTAVALSKRWEDLTFVIFMPIFNPYKILLKFFRIIGYAQELFFSYSYLDHFTPYKVRQRMMRW